MADRSYQSQSFHDRMIKQLAEHLVNKKFRDVKADLPDFPDKPVPIATGEATSGRVPDITAIGIQMVIFEVETEDTIHSPHAREQWELFASYADRNMADFWIVVPKANKDEARERVASLGLNAKVMGI